MFNVYPQMLVAGQGEGGGAEGRGLNLSSALFYPFTITCFLF